MFGIDINILAFIGLATLAVFGLVYAFMFESVSNEAAQEKRMRSIKNRDENKRSAAQSRVSDVAKRKQTVQDSLKELEDSQKAKDKKKLTLKSQLRQAGLQIDVKQFYIYSLVAGLVGGGIAFVSMMNPLAGVAGLIVGGIGIPRFVISKMRKKRMNKFLEEFPNSVDVIVRGVKAGLPLNDCLAIIARESPEPVAGEFKRIIDTQAMGIPMTEAILKLYENIPLTEANFFGIVVSIQQQAGGNLSESLGNLSKVLRDRKKMKAKIQAMSSEAKASGMIIGSLPFIVGLLVYITTPDYIGVLFNTPQGNMVLGGAAIWMSTGIFIMKRMINFDF